MCHNWNRISNLSSCQMYIVQNIWFPLCLYYSYNSNMLIALVSIKKTFSPVCLVCPAATFYSAAFSKPNPLWFGKVTPKKCVGFSKPIPVWFGKNLILLDAYSKPNSYWFGKFWWPFSTSWKVQKIIDYCQCLKPWTNLSFIL